MKQNKEKKILGVIPARGGSKGIKDKNIIPLCGRPLIWYTEKAIAESKLLNRVILSTDSEKIAKAVTDSRIEISMRPAELARDHSKTTDVLKWLLNELKEKENYMPDYLVILQPTSPLRSGADIDACIEKLLSDQTADSVVSVCEAPHNCIPEKIMYMQEDELKPYCSESEKYTIRQEVPQYYARNGAAVYAFNVNMFLKMGSLYGNRCIPYIMSDENSVDIDTPFDLFIVEAILEKRKKLETLG